MSMIQACSSQWAMAMPLEAPLPARPTICSDPMFEASREQPTTNQLMSRPARKKSVVVFTRREDHQTIAIRRMK
jgi:hypothetical protein